MRLPDNYKDKNVLVLGLARSGAGAANLLAVLGASVTVADNKSPEELAGFIKLLLPGVGISYGPFIEHLFRDSDFIVVSPGVPLSIPLLKEAVRAGKRVIGETELAYNVIKFVVPTCVFHGVTGTNGKSTTVTLLYEMLKKSGKDALLSGNIGNPLSVDALRLVSENRIRGMESPNPIIKENSNIVMELSSFQLESIRRFRPKVSAILNISPDHLDRYDSLSDYCMAKQRVFLNQEKSDFLVINADDPNMAGIHERLADKGPDIYQFSTKQKVKGAFFRDEKIVLKIPETAESVLNPKEFLIRGIHNMENAMAASLMAVLSGCAIDGIASGLRDFPGLEHRLEFVDKIDGVEYINDSKGTNTGAVVKSLESFDSPVILIAGGKDKGCDFSALRGVIRDKVKALVLIGEASEKIQDAAGDCTNVFMEAGLKEATTRSKTLAKGGDVVLLSPACASFDMFGNFEERGLAFKRAVGELRRNGS